MNPLELTRHGPVIPVIVLQRVEDAVPLARALVEGGVRVLEVTMRTPVALRCIEAIAAAVPEAIVGAGTVRGTADAKDAQAAGSRFAVSPGYTAELGRACRDLHLPLLPGVATAAGGIPMLKALAGPFPDVQFCPTGGITASTAPQFLALPNVPVCGGSWLTPADSVQAGDWGRITALAREAAALRSQSLPAA
jgi:2-dehydro-3-deoxyphosphogluconate aldolase/(4S)-4-hydroxy-2-oxoglutarate aldolase